MLVVSTASATGAVGTNEYVSVPCGVYLEDTQFDTEGYTMHRTCSADSDGDGLTAPEEAVLGVDPRVNSWTADNDDDGLPNVYEVKTGLEPEKKNEGVVDYDGDGIPDRTELEYGLDPFTDSATGKDSDYDHLPDEIEQKIGTDPHETDTDGDGFNDYAEVTETKKLPNADPLHKDVYFEVDKMGGQNLDYQEKRRAELLFERVRVSNPDGENGITVHFISSDVLPHQSTVEFEDGGFEMERQHRDYENRGYHYLVVVDELTLYGEDSEGAANDMKDVTLIDSTAPSTTIVHETGHLLGISHNDHYSIDSHETSFSTYSSVMNYNRPSSDDYYENQDYTIFSDGSNGPDDYDDLADIRAGLKATYAPNVNDGPEN